MCLSKTYWNKRGFPLIHVSILLWKCPWMCFSSSAESEIFHALCALWRTPSTVFFLWNLCCSCQISHYHLFPMCRQLPLRWIKPKYEITIARLTLINSLRNTYHPKCLTDPHCSHYGLLKQLEVTCVRFIIQSCVYLGLHMYECVF